MILIHLKNTSAFALFIRELVPHLKLIPAPSMEFPNHTLSQGVVGWCKVHEIDLRPAFIRRGDVWLNTKQLDAV
jgi:hypothetical protein